MINKGLKPNYLSIDNRSVNSHTNRRSLLLILWRFTGIYPDSLLPEGTISYLDAEIVFFIQMNPPLWQL